MKTILEDATCWYKDTDKGRLILRKATIDDLDMLEIRIKQMHKLLNRYSLVIYEDLLRDIINWISSSDLNEGVLLVENKGKAVAMRIYQKNYMKITVVDKEFRRKGIMTAGLAVGLSLSADLEEDEMQRWEVVADSDKASKIIEKALEKLKTKLRVRVKKLNPYGKNFFYIDADTDYVKENLVDDCAEFLGAPENKWIKENTEIAREVEK